ncbi:MAG: glycine cleavage system aminomethyltransferase GcvT [Fibrobacterales bacterium]
MSTLKRTPLFDEYAKYNGKIVPFAGYEMPVSFAGIKAEHEAVRERVGLFDVSHMGLFYVSGEGSEAFLNSITSNNVSKIVTLQVQYSALCNKAGGVIDDILVYKLGTESYQIIVNAANIDKDYDWVTSRVPDGVTVVNASPDMCILALQGPLAVKIAEKVCDHSLSGVAYYNAFKTTIAGEEFLVSRTGYTGEDGFEFFPKNGAAVAVWNVLMEAGQEYGIEPIGLGARDTLRLEAGFSLYGQELNDTRNVLESGLGWITDLNKDTFIGKEALVASKTAGFENKIVGIELIDKGIPRIGCSVTVNGTVIGEITSGSVIPTTAKAISMAFINAEYAKVGSEVDVMIRDKAKKARVVSRRFKK